MLKGAAVSEIPEAVHCRFNDNFKLMVIKHAEETNNCTVAPSDVSVTLYCSNTVIL
jgi:hypothetical protein